MNRTGAIAWPDQTKIVSRDKRHATLDYIQNLFYNAGLVTSVIYLALKLLLVPALEEQYSQRVGFSALTLFSARKLVSKLQRSLHSTPISVIGYNERAKTVERCTQTSEDDLEARESRWTVISKRLCDSTLLLREFSRSNTRPMQHMDTFNVEARMLSDRLKTKIDADSPTDTGKNIVQSVREVKGWFVSGRIY